MKICPRLDVGLVVDFGNIVIHADVNVILYR